MPLAEQLGALREMQVGGKIGHLGLFEVTVAELAEVVEGPPALEQLTAIKRAVVRLCATAYPLSELAEILRPAALIVTKNTFDVAGASLNVGIPLFVVDQRQFRLRAPHRDTAGVLLPYLTPIDVWAPALAQRLVPQRETRSANSRTSRRMTRTRRKQSLAAAHDHDK